MYTPSPELDKMTIPQLKSHRTAVNQAIDQTVKAKQDALRAKLARMAEEGGLRIPSLQVQAVKPNGNHGKSETVTATPPAKKLARPDVAERNRQRAKRAKPKSDAPQYRNPANSDQTWVGRGPRPNWLRDAMKAPGAKLEQFKVAG